MNMYNPALSLESTSLFTDGNLAFLTVALICRLLAIGVSIRLLVRNTPFFGRFSPTELRKPFIKLSKQQQYRYVCSIFLLATLVIHLIYILLDMLLVSPETPLSYQTGKINITYIVTNIFTLAYICALWITLSCLILTEIDRYNRLTLVVPGSLRAKAVHGAGQIVKVFTFVIIVFYLVNIVIRIRDEASQSNAFSSDTMVLISAIRSGFTMTLTVFGTILEFYLNLSMVKCVLFKSEIKPSMATTQTSASDRTRVLGFLIFVLMAHLIAIALMAIGRFMGLFQPFIMLAMSALSIAVSTSFSLTDTLLNCLHESKQEKLDRESQVDITGYKTGTDVIEEGLMLTGVNVSHTITQFPSGSQLKIIL